MIIKPCFLLLKTNFFLSLAPCFFFPILGPVFTIFDTWPVPYTLKSQNSSITSYAKIFTWIFFSVTFGYLLFLKIDSSLGSIILKCADFPSSFSYHSFLVLYPVSLSLSLFKTNYPLRLRSWVKIFSLLYLLTERNYLFSELSCPFNDFQNYIIRIKLLPNSVSHFHLLQKHFHL